MNNYNQSNNYNDFVSVIIPCYNSEKTIVNTLNSLSEQEYKNFEIIIINDGSTDNTLDVVNDYFINHPLLIYNVINQNNSGVSIARNKGLESARGKYITFLDSDDMYSTDFISEMVHYINKYNADTACCFLSTKKNEIEDNKVAELIVTNIELMRIFMYKTPDSTSFFNFIYRKEIIDKYSIKFPINLKYGEDNEFCYKYLSHIDSGVLINKKMYWYNRNIDSVTNKASWDVTDALKAIENVAIYLKKNQHTFYNEFNNYLPIKTSWSIAKKFAQFNERDLFDRFVKEKNLQENIKKLIKSDNKLLGLSSRLMSINSSIFYYIIRLYYDLKRYK